MDFVPEFNLLGDMELLPEITPILDFEEPMQEDMIFSGGDAILSSSNVAPLESPILLYDTDKFGEEDLQPLSGEVVSLNIDTSALNLDVNTLLSDPIVLGDLDQYLPESELTTMLQPPSPEFQPSSNLSEPFSPEYQPLSNVSEPLSVSSESNSAISEPYSPASETSSTVSEQFNVTDGGIIIQSTQQTLEDPLMDIVNHLNIKTTSTASTNLNINTASPLPTTLNITSIPTEVKMEVKPKKRGRKPKSETGLTRRELRRLKKVKVYEMPPLLDQEAEKKRKNALNAKRHRDMAKQRMAEVEESLEAMKKERDQLLQEVQKLRQSEQNLRQLLNQRQCGLVMS